MVKLSLEELGKRLYKEIYGRGKESVEGTITLETDSNTSNGLSGRATFNFLNCTATGTDFNYDREDMHEYEGNRESMLGTYLSHLQKATNPAVAEKTGYYGNTMSVKVKRLDLKDL